jgi:hypothetical protein
MAESLASSQPGLSMPGPDIHTGAIPRFRLELPEIITLLLYGGLLAWALPHHEPWADEAQAWQIVRTLPIRQIFSALSYEGHPGFWYLCLWVLSRLHVSYFGMRCFAAAIGFLGVAVLVTTSPFPRFIKLLLPFTFYLAFQYAIVARSYVFVPLLLFLCAYFWPQRLHRPITIALCLGLLANVALHAAVISGGLAITYLIDLWRGRREVDLDVSRVGRYSAAALLLALYGVSVWVALPPKDTSGAGFVIRPGTAQTQPIEAQQSNLPPRYPRAEPENRSSVQWLAWKIESRLAELTEGLMQPFWLGCAFWVLLTWKLFRTRKLHYLIPAVFLVILSHVYAFFWHSGLVLPCVIALLWMTWPEQLPFERLPLYEQLPLLMLLLISVEQISWAEFAFQFDRKYQYGSGAATAAFLKPYVLSNTEIVEIGNDFLSVGVQPYFDHNIFLNQPYAYYWWSTRNSSKFRYRKLLAERPGIVVVEWRFRNYPTTGTIGDIGLVKQLNGLGYSNTHTFCGGLVKPGREILEWDCDVIFQPSLASIVQRATRAPHANNSMQLPNRAAGGLG